MQVIEKLLSESIYTKQKQKSVASDNPSRTQSRMDWVCFSVIEIERAKATIAEGQPEKDHSGFSKALRSIFHSFDLIHTFALQRGVDEQKIVQQARVNLLKSALYALKFHSLAECKDRTRMAEQGLDELLTYVHEVDANKACLSKVLDAHIKAAAHLGCGVEEFLIAQKTPRSAG